MTPHIAIHKIRTSKPGSGLTATGQYDPEGNPILKRIPTIIQPGEYFEMADEKTIAYLIAQGAAREPTEAELALRESQLAKAAAVEADVIASWRGQ